MVTKKNPLKKRKKQQIKLSYTNINYDEKTFLTMIEKRVRKDLRINKKIKSKTILLLNDGSKEFRMAKQLLQSIFGENFEIKIVKKIEKNVLVPTSLDRKIKKNLEVYLQNKKIETKKLNILNNVLEEEIILFCKLKKIKIGKVEAKLSLIESIEATHPGTKFALAKSFENIS